MLEEAVKLNDLDERGQRKFLFLVLEAVRRNDELFNHIRDMCAKEVIIDESNFVIKVT